MTGITNVSRERLEQLLEDSRRLERGPPSPTTWNARQRRKTAEQEAQQRGDSV